MARWNVNSTAYTIVYSLILAVVVSVVLALVAAVLHPFQERNQKLEKMNYILHALGIYLDNPDSVEAYYQRTVYEVVGRPSGEIEETGSGPGPAFAVSVAQEYKVAPDARRLPVYIYLGEDEPVFVLPMWGTGLWGPIWGYVALDADLKTIHGVVFDHKSETPGLGAEIATLEFQQRFKGKLAYDDQGNVLIRVLKPTLVHQETEIEGLSGATMTTKGLDAMLREWLALYRPLLEKLKKEQPWRVASSVARANAKSSSAPLGSDRGRTDDRESI